MNVSGPLPIPPVQQSDAGELALRVNQRFNAEVLQVSGDRVALAVEGIRVIGQLTSAEQAAQLLERRYAQFVVRDLNSETVTLQLLQPGSATNPAAASTPDLIPNLLNFAGLEISPSNVLIARALLNNGLPVTAELAAELQTVLAQSGSWTQVDAEIAAMLKAAGLPLTGDTLALARSDLPSVMDLLSDLKTQLQALHGRLSPELAAKVQNALELLDRLLVNWDASGPELVEKLRQAISLFGSSVEQKLSAQLQGSPAGSPADSLLALAFLRRDLGENAPPALQDALDRFLQGARLMQFVNADTEGIPDKGRWVRMELPLAAQGANTLAGDSLEQQLHTARLRIAYRPDAVPPTIDPNNTRLVIRIDLDGGEAIQVDLSVVGRRIGAQVTASSDGLRDLAEDELPGLEEGLKKVGYVLQTARCEIGKLASMPITDSPSTWSAFSEVSVEA